MIGETKVTEADQRAATGVIHACNMFAFPEARAQCCVAEAMQPERATAAKLAEVLRRLKHILKNDQAANIWLNYPETPEETPITLIDNVLAEYEGNKK